MQPKIVRAKSLKETLTSEHCYIFENWGSENVSIARARVKAGFTTEAHHLVGVDENLSHCKRKGHSRNWNTGAN